MPREVKNTGIQSLSELFATKKNIAYQATFNHRMKSMAKDYYHKKANFKQEINFIYNEMKEIRASTGHTLDQVRSAEREGRTFKKPNAPSVYLPPIGIRLMRKYVGVDMKRRISLFDADGNTHQTTLPTFGSFPNQKVKLKADVETKHVTHASDKHNDKTNIVKSDKEGDMTEIFIKTKNTEHDIIQSPENDNANARNIHIKTSTIDETNPPIRHKDGDSKEEESNKTTVRITEDASSGLKRQEVLSTIDEGIITPVIIIDPIFSLTRERHIDAKNAKTVNVESESCLQVNNDNTLDNDEALDKSTSSDDSLVEDVVFPDTMLNWRERRSSRSTFRTRNSIRLNSNSGILSENNLAAIAKSRNGKKTPKSGKSILGKESVGPFYLDYGDGMLHDSMEIPKFKDCSRPWCNPFCKTCQDRTTRRPCFLLIPADEKVPKRKIPQDKRRLSMFPVYGSSMEPPDTPCESDHSPIPKTPQTKNDNAIKAVATVDMSSENKKIDAKGLVDLNDETDAPILEEKEEAEQKKRLKIIAKMLQDPKEDRKKGYNKKKMDQLALPRGGPPAEVRFSKTSLRRKQVQLVEQERMKALSKIEKENLTLIQGKISVFLAVLNQFEVTGKPQQMVDIPIREDITKHKMVKPIVKIGKRFKRYKAVHFNIKSRYRLLS